MSETQFLALLAAGLVLWLGSRADRRRWQEWWRKRPHRLRLIPPRLENYHTLADFQQRRYEHALVVLLLKQRRQQGLGETIVFFEHEIERASEADVLLDYNPWARHLAVKLKQPAQA